MTTTAAPFGLKPVRTLGGKPFTGGLTSYNIANSTTHDLYVGDPVHLQSGFIRRCTAADGADAVGVFMGCHYVDPNTGRPTWGARYPANTSSDAVMLGRPSPVALVADDPDLVFIVQANASVTTADVGLNFNVTVSAGNNTFGTSRAHLVASSRASAAENGWRMVGLHDRPGNEYSNENTLDLYPIVEVICNNHQHRTALVSTA